MVNIVLYVFFWLYSRRGNYRSILTLPESCREIMAEPKQEESRKMVIAFVTENNQRQQQSDTLPFGSSINTHNYVFSRLKVKF